MERKKILLIEDEVKLARFVELELKYEGYDVTTCHDGRVGMEMITNQEFDMVLLDLMLPGLTGIEICRRVRKFSQVPIIMLTAKDEVMDKVAGLDSGADDYLTKPFETEECLARVYALLRRFHELNPLKTRAYSIVAHGDLMMKRDTRQALISGRPLELTYREYELLNLFMSHPERVFTFEQLYEQVWAEPYMGNKNSVVCEMKRLRKKLGDTDPIEAVREVGYRFKKE